jgi:hypothetical protein
VNDGSVVSFLSLLVTNHDFVGFTLPLGDVNAFLNVCGLSVMYTISSASRVSLSIHHLVRLLAVLRDKHDGHGDFAPAYLLVSIVMRNW